MSTRNRRKKKSRVNKKKVFFFLMIIIIVSGFFLMRKLKIAKRDFCVRKIIIEGLEQLNQEDVLSILDVKKDDIISSPERKKMVEKLKKNIWVKDAIIRKGPFGRLIIVITERNPIAVLKNSAPMLLCSDGKIIPYKEKDEFANLPSVYIDAKKDLLSYCALIRKIKLLFDQRPITIYFNDNKKTFVKVNGFTVIIDRREPFSLGTALSHRFTPLESQTAYREGETKIHSTTNTDSKVPHEVLTGLTTKALYKIFNEMKRKGYSICDMRFRNQIIFEKGGAL